LAQNKFGKVNGKKRQRDVQQGGFSLGAGDGVIISEKVLHGKDVS